MLILFVGVVVSPIVGTAGMLAQRNTHTHTQSKVESTLCARVVDVRQHRNYTPTNR